MTGDEHTIDLTGGAPSPSPSPNGNGHGALAGANGHGPGHGAPVADEAAITPGGELDGIGWYPSYDRESVERHLRELDEERARLEAQIADAERRTTEAEELLATRTAELEAGLGAVVVAARAELARIDRERDEAVAAIRAEAEQEATRIREAARQEAATVRGAAASLSSPGAVPEPVEGGFDAG